VELPPRRLEIAAACLFSSPGASEGRSAGRVCRAARGRRCEPRPGGLLPLRTRPSRRRALARWRAATAGPDAREPGAVRVPHLVQRFEASSATRLRAARAGQPPRVRDATAVLAEGEPARRARTGRRVCASQRVAAQPARGAGFRRSRRSSIAAAIPPRDRRLRRAGAPPSITAGALAAPAGRPPAADGSLAARLLSDDGRSPARRPPRRGRARQRARARLGSWARSRAAAAGWQPSLTYMIADDELAQRGSAPSAEAGAPLAWASRAGRPRCSGLHGSLGNDHTGAWRAWPRARSVEVRRLAPGGRGSVQSKALKQRDHRKLVVVDGSVALTAADRNSGHDVHYTARSPSRCGQRAHVISGGASPGSDAGAPASKGPWGGRATLRARPSCTVKNRGSTWGGAHPDRDRASPRPPAR
jgi:hypothetical protein